MKRIRTTVSIMLMLCLCFALSACGDSAERTGNDSSVPPVAESTEGKSE